MKNKEVKAIVTGHFVKSFESMVIITSVETLAFKRKSNSKVF